MDGHWYCNFDISCKSFHFEAVGGFPLRQICHCVACKLSPFHVVSSLVTSSIVTSLFVGLLGKRRALTTFIWSPVLSLWSPLENSSGGCEGLALSPTQLQLSQGPRTQPNFPHSSKSWHQVAGCLSNKKTLCCWDSPPYLRCHRQLEFLSAPWNP